MIRILAVSPHLDDAVFSAGARLAEHAMAGDAVTVVTCFTGNVAQPTGFALACQLDKGLGSEIDYMALRRAEDAEACAAIGAEPLHLPLLEAPHRGYDSAAALFGNRLPGDTVLPDLVAALERVAADYRPDLVYAPCGVGNHVDHHLVREAVTRVSAETRVVWWEDYPYAMREPAPPVDVARRPVNGAAAERKMAATLAYRSQLGFQFGGAAAAEAALRDWRMEGFSLSPAAAIPA